MTIHLTLKIQLIHLRHDFFPSSCIGMKINQTGQPITNKKAGMKIPAQTTCLLAEL